MIEYGGKLGVSMNNKPTIFSIIEEANKEYKENGRTEKFISFENRLIKSRKPKFIYMFARYVAGADLSKAENALIKLKALKEGYFFARYIANANVLPFLELAVQLKDEHWITHLYLLAEEQGKITEANKVVGDRVIKRRDGTKLEPTISKALTLKKQEDLEEIEKEVFDSVNITDHILYASRVRSTNLNELEDDLLLHGNPLNCLVASKDVIGINRRKMLVYAMLSKYDYSKVLNEQKMLKELYSQLDNYKTKLAILLESSSSSEKNENNQNTHLIKVHKQKLRLQEKIKYINERINYYENNPNHVEYVNAICRDIRDLIHHEEVYGF